MYEVYLDGKNLYYPGDKVNALSSAILDRKVSESGRLDIKVPPTNPLFTNFKERVSEVTVYENGEEIWNGEVRSINGNMRNERSVYILGELSYLNASSQPQKKYDDIDVMQFFKILLDEHNSKVETRKQFHVGIVTVENVNNITSWVTNYEKTLDYIRTELCEKTNGHLRIRKVHGVRYLDLIRLEDYGKSTEQPIKFGKNLLDFTSDITSDSIVTAIRPLGAKLEESNVEGLDAYTTISSVNNGSDSLVNQDAIDSGIGYVWETVHFEGIKDPAELMMEGKNWLQSKQFADMTIMVTAVDLSKLNSRIESFELGDSVRTVAEPFGMDKWSYIMQKKVDLLNPTTKHNINIGEKLKKTYTQQISMIQGLMEKQFPQQTILLELAKKNASEIIKSATEGNIYLINDDNGVPKELLIMDTPDINTARRVWRWNINGLGYSSTGYNGTFGVAMTMDGQIVADFITAGTMNCDRLNGGTIKGQIIEGGNVSGAIFNNGNGTFYVDVNGHMTAYSGNIGPWIFTSNTFMTSDYELQFHKQPDDGTWRISNRNGSCSIGALVAGNGYVTIGGDLDVSGTKSRLTDTDNYGRRLLYCYETPSPIFGDLGEGVIDETGKCCIFLDDIFSETIDTDCTYQVFLQPYGSGECYVKERSASYFIVEGTEDLSFGWEIKAVQKDYDTVRLEQFQEKETEADVLSETYSYLETFLYDVEREVE